MKARGATRSLCCTNYVSQSLPSRLVCSTIVKCKQPLFPFYFEVGTIGWIIGNLERDISIYNVITFNLRINA